jgi:hypothetical protein
MMMGREKIFITPEKRKKHDFFLPFFCATVYLNLGEEIN